MRLTERDKRALVILAAAVVVMLVLRVWLDRRDANAVSPAVESVAAAEQRLAHVRKLAAEAPMRRKQIEALEAEVRQWEKGLIAAETAQQAQGQMLQILRRLAGSQEPKIEFRSEEIGPVRPLDKQKYYGQALVTVSFVCGVEQLVNFLAELATVEEALGAEELSITSTNPKDKTLGVRLTVAGLIPARLVPESRGAGVL